MEILILSRASLLKARMKGHKQQKNSIAPDLSRKHLWKHCDVILGIGMTSRHV